MNEEIVVILDASFSMGDEIQRHSVDQPIESEDFLGTTKLDVARYIVQQLLFCAAAPSGPLQDQTKVLALITLGKGPALVGKKRKRPSRCRSRETPPGIGLVRSAAGAEQRGAPADAAHGDDARSLELVRERLEPRPRLVGDLRLGEGAARGESLT